MKGTHTHTVDVQHTHPAPVCAGSSSHGWQRGKRSYAQALCVHNRCCYRGATVNRTYGTHKKLYMSLFSLTSIWSYLLWPPVIGTAQIHDVMTKKKNMKKKKQGGGGGGQAAINSAPYATK